MGTGNPRSVKRCAELPVDAEMVGAAAFRKAGFSRGAEMVGRVEAEASA